VPHYLNRSLYRGHPSDDEDARAREREKERGRGKDEERREKKPEKRLAPRCCYYNDSPLPFALDAPPPHIPSRYFRNEGPCYSSREERRSLFNAFEKDTCVYIYIKLYSRPCGRQHRPARVSKNNFSAFLLTRGVSDATGRDGKEALARGQETSKLVSPPLLRGTSKGLSEVSCLRASLPGQKPDGTRHRGSTRDRPRACKLRYEILF